jgi:drug/metabolite transporter (DMT)-like permease
MNERKKAILQLLAAAVLWSTGGILIKLVDWNPVAIAGSRSLIAGFLILFYLKKPKILCQSHSWLAQVLMLAQSSCLL